MGVSAWKAGAPGRQSAWPGRGWDLGGWLKGECAARCGLYSRLTIAPNIGVDEWGEEW